MLIYASTIAIQKKAVMITGAPGAGKSDLALRLIDEGAELISDDQTEISRVQLVRGGQGLQASPPSSIAGMIEVRHVGLLRLPFLASAEIALYIELISPNTAAPGTLLSEDAKPPRLPIDDVVFLLDCPIRRLRLPAFAASTAAKIRFALLYPRTDD